MWRQVCGEGKRQEQGTRCKHKDCTLILKQTHGKTHTHTHTFILTDLKKKRLGFSVKSGEIESKLYLTSEACLNYTCNQNPCATATCNMQRVQQQRLQLAARAAHTYEINHNNRHCPSATDSLKCWARHRKPHTRAHTEHTHTEQTHTHLQVVCVFGLQAAISAVC